MDPVCWVSKQLSQLGTFSTAVLAAAATDVKDQGMWPNHRFLTEAASV